ncbi:MAG: CARDB domain-containing protein, partial [Candidatus Thermoplasmatota archaeon]|nr:CARDB domain-containing protein [Candidatus Thermoplasmatota archaeon]
PVVFATILIIVVFLILIIVVFILTTKSADIICFERIKEISPEENARFEITVKNPTKKTQSYELSLKENLESSKWDASLDLKRARLEPGQSRTVVLIVRPTDLIKTDDWAEIGIVVKTEGMRKTEEMTAMTLIKDSKAELSIGGVTHWPRSFKRGDRVTTSFKVKNKGNASASGIDVILYINDKEKNKVDDVIIPAGGYAGIRMPWIVGKNKNEINIVVR